MPKQLIIAGASSIIGLQNAGRLDLLKVVYEEIRITEEVKREVGTDLPEWVKIIEISNRDIQNVLELEVDKGEASAITAALENKDSTLIIDEKRGRRVAKRLGVKVIGTIGVIILGKDLGLIEAGKPVLEALIKKGFRISIPLLEKVVTRLGE